LDIYDFVATSIPFEMVTNISLIELQGLNL